MADPDPELARFLSSLSLWLDGVSKFIAVSKSEWRNASTGHHLMAQTLRQHTLKLKQQINVLEQRFVSLEPRTGRSETAAGESQNTAVL
jgi:hypothetical protein